MACEGLTHPTGTQSSDKVASGMATGMTRRYRLPEGSHRLQGQDGLCVQQRCPLLGVFFSASSSLTLPLGGRVLPPHLGPGGAATAPS